MQAGTWRDWITAIRFVSADGRIIRSGADVVKSVTGFDLHKLIIGSRFTLGIPVSVTIVVRPFQNKPTYPPIHADLPEGCQLILADPSYLKTLPPSTIQHLNLESKLALVQWTGDNHKGSVWTSNHGIFNLPTFPSPIATLMQKLKEEFDPHHKLNPGGMGIF
jgi:FAD/FMN-containing dehydrogenase